MAIYHLHVKTWSRGAGKGAGGHARYLLRQGPYAKKMVEVVEGATVRQEEQSRTDEVVASFSGNMPSWAQEDPLAYWDAADAYERANGTVYREIEFALPAELSVERNLGLARDFAESLSSVSGGATPYTLAIHRSEKNPNLLHAHLMLSDKIDDGYDRDPALWFRRAIPKTGRGSKKSPELGGAPKTQERIAETWLREVVRPLWTKLANAALERAGFEGRIDHRSLEEQRREQEALVEQALEMGDVVAVARHREAAALLDKPAQPKRGRVLEHGGPEKAPGQALVWHRYEEACTARQSALEVIEFSERERQRLEEEIARVLERREAARREFAESHREATPDRAAIVQAVAALVVQEAHQAREEVRACWEDRQRQRAVRQEREARRQKLLVLAEVLAKDQACSLSLRQVYLEAGYQRQQQGDKWVFVYPHDALQAEREEVSAAQKIWDQRKRNRELDHATEQESRPGIRHPSKPRWRVERERILEEVYGPELAEKLGRWYRIERLDDAWVLQNDSATITDYGDRVTAAAGNEREIEAMVELAKAKGWENVSLTGSAEFRERAALAFVREGFALTDPDLERVAQKALRREAVLEKAMLRHGYRDPVEAQWTRDRWSWRQREREQRLTLEREREQRREREVVAELLEGTDPAQPESLERRLAQLQAQTRPATAEELRQAREQAYRSYEEAATGNQKFWVEEIQKLGGWEQTLAVYRERHRNVVTGLMAWMPSRKAEAEKIEGQIQAMEFFHKERHQAAQEAERVLQKAREAGAARWEALAPYVDAARKVFREQREAWLDAQRKAEERKRQAAIEADRARRREKLLEFGQRLRADYDARMDLTAAYREAGYRLQERDGKRLWVYPQDDLQREVQDVYQARRDWDTRKRERIERERAEEEQAKSAIREPRYGGQQNPVPMFANAHPQRKTPWREWREQTLEERYGDAVAARAQRDDWYIRMRPDLGGLNIMVSTNTGSLEVIDGGDILRSESDGLREIPLMLDLARAKGWLMLNIEGSAPFREHAARAALRAGFDLVDKALEQKAREALKRENVQSLPNEAAEIERRQRSSPKRGSTPGDDWF